MKGITSSPKYDVKDDKKTSLSLNNRNFDRIKAFWCNLMFKTSLPQFIIGNNFNSYGITDLKSIHDSGLIEFNSNDPRYKRQTFAIRIGYDGSSYNGYQRQKGDSVVKFVYTVAMIDRVICSTTIFNL